MRGFNEREIAMDNGVRATLEVYTPELWSSLSEKMHIRALGFMDYGQAWMNHLDSGERHEVIGSLGLGLHLNWDKKLSVKADWAQAVDGNAEGTALHKTKTGDRFMHVGATYAF